MPSYWQFLNVYLLVSGSKMQQNDLGKIEIMGDTMKIQKRINENSLFYKQSHVSLCLKRTVHYKSNTDSICKRGKEYHESNTYSICQKKNQCSKSNADFIYQRARITWKATQIPLARGKQIKMRAQQSPFERRKQLSKTHLPVKECISWRECNNYLWWKCNLLQTKIKGI